LTGVFMVRPMTEEDLPTVDVWLRLAHVARWWLKETTAQAVIAKYHHRIREEQPATTMLMLVTEDGAPVGWCQWYRWADYPAEAAAMEASENDIGIDYAIGDPTFIGRGAGTELVAALVALVRRHHPLFGVLVAADAANLASRRVLEKNGFDLVRVQSVATEPTDAPMAIYRLSPLRRPTS